MDTKTILSNQQKAQNKANTKQTNKQSERNNGNMKTFVF